MKSFVLATVFVLGFGAAASAADAVEEVVIVDEAYDWSGVYVGFTAGASDHDARWTDPADDWFPDSLEFGSTSAVVGGYVGYNFVVGPVILGVEGDIVGAFNDDDGSGPWYDETYQNDLKWLASLRGRIGVPVDRLLVYATGGVAFAGVKNEMHSDDYPDEDFEDTDSTLTGFAVGGGVEYAMNSNLILRFEGLYYDFGSDTYAQQVGGELMEIENDVVVVRAGIGYKF